MHLQYDSYNIFFWSMGIVRECQAIIKDTHKGAILVEKTIAKDIVSYLWFLLEDMLKLGKVRIFFTTPFLYL